MKIVYLFFITFYILQIFNIENRRFSGSFLPAADFVFPDMDADVKNCN